MEFNVADDINLICKLLNISFSQLSNYIDIDENTLFRVITKETFLSLKNCEKLYQFIFSQNIMINKIKEMIYEEERKNDEIILYHGSKSEIFGPISLCNSRKNNDFGQGFYCGKSYEQSASFVESFPKSSVYVLKFKPNDLKKVEFSVNTDWMLVIAYYMGRLDNYKNNKKLINLIEKVENADYIIAPIADNKMFKIIDSFIDGNLTDEQCKFSLAATNLGNQYVFKTEKSLKYITILEKLYFVNDEKKLYKIKKIENGKISDDKVKVVKIKYKGIGKYIDEVLK